MNKELWQERMGKDGTHYVHSMRTGHTYWIEVIDEKQDPRPTWGDLSANGKEVSTKAYASKTRRGIHPSESAITEENGFKNIQVIPKGSPYSAIEELDSKYPTLER